MYYEHFGFQVPPFSISPDPKFLYLSDRHRDALAHLIYGAGENGGFVLLTGQVGTGKTTLIRSLLSQKLPDVDIALCLHSGLSVIDFVASILDELNVDYPRDASSLKPLVDALNAHLLKKHAEGRQIVLIIDEGQNLSREVLEQVRLLTNLETDNQKLLRIILVGQEELQDIINRPDLRQLSQRITGRYHLTSLNANEVTEYIKHRIQTAKGNPSIFTSNAVKQVYRYTKGTPRLINVLCDRALLVSYNSDAYRVSSKHIKLAAEETMPQHIPHSGNHKYSEHRLSSWLLLPSGILAVLSISYGAYHYLSNLSSSSKRSVVEEKNNVSRETFIATESRDEQAEAAELTVGNEPKQGKVNQKKTEPITEKKKVAKPSIQAFPLVTTEAKLAAGQSNSENFVEKSKATNSKQALNFSDSLLPPSIVVPNERASSPHVGVSQTEGVKILLKRWNLATDLSANQTACEYAESQQMQCLSAQGGLPLVKNINRPVLLEYVYGNRRTWLPIVAFDDNNMTCLIADKLEPCDIGDIANHWTGNFLVLLRKPKVSVKLIPGFSGEQTKWLRQRIAISEGKDITGIDTSLRFDKELVERVKIFQKSRDLSVDGVIGDKTLLYLHNVVTDEGTPTLHTED